ncbi:MAG: ATP-binding protein, partial [Planktothrix sp.]
MAIAILDYQIGELLHESSNSRIYRAVGLSDNQPVILKLLNQAYPSPEKIAQFKREYQTTQSLNFPGVINAYCLETSEHQWVMVIEDFGGVSLKTIIQNQPLTLSQFLPIAIDIAEILYLVHQQQIIHKDINPSNLVLNPNTQELKLIDFGISTQLSRENPTFRNPNLLEGTLPYIAPEQTGRMNRSVDYRSDFYSLGATFYELLTGRVPFPSDDPLALVHSHLAQQPIPPHQINPEIPEAISHIILKLMSKNAEDRYQSAYGLKRDLEECLRQWQTTEQIQPFPLATQDILARLQIPQKLYGREREVTTLLTAYQRITTIHNNQNNQPELMLISGYSGIGKTALVQEIYKPITRSKGYFISGKFDQLQRNIPYASLIQAFRSLIKQLLTETEAEISQWREKLLNVLGANGQVIIEVIPEVETIIGTHPPIPELSPAEAQNRFNLTFQNFIKVFTQPEHPLAIFLDDLQWADNASLQLIQRLMTETDSQHLFLIGAYRDNEVSAAHPLMLTVEEIKKHQVIVQEISLKPLELPDINQLIVDTLHQSPQQVEPLAELVQRKTGGNPFFLTEFLKTLYSENLLTFDYNERKWIWDIKKIQEQPIANNVVDLMAEKLYQLPLRTQQVLQLAACVGNQFELKTLALIEGTSMRETALALKSAMTEGFVLPLSNEYKLIELDVEGLEDRLSVNYKFAHDRIQQAAYALISESEKPQFHFQIGRLLLDHAGTQEREQKLFDIVNHLNLGKTQLFEKLGKEELAKLNLKAGKKAKKSAAYQPALNYLQAGVELLQEESWLSQYDLTLNLYEEAAEAALLNTNFEEMERFATTVLEQGKTPLDKLKVYEVRIQSYTAQSQLLEAVNTGLEFLELFNFTFPEQPTASDIMQALQETQSLLADQRMEDLIELTTMTDPALLAVMRTFTTLFMPTFVVKHQLLPLLVSKQVNLSVQYGNTPESSYAYAMYGLLLCGGGDIDGGYQFAQLSFQILSRFNAEKLKANVLLIGYAFLCHWKAHLRDIQSFFLEAYQSGLSTGDFDNAANAAATYSIIYYLRGNNLQEVEPEMAKYAEEIARIKQSAILNWQKIYWQSVHNLLGNNQNPTELIGEVYDEKAMLPVHLEVNDKASLFNFYFNKLILAFLFNEESKAIEYLETCEEYFLQLTTSYYAPFYNFYDSLIRLAIYPDAPEPEQQRILEKVTANQEKMQLWAQQAPMNCLHKYYLVEAERARILNNDLQARDYYDRAISLAKEHEYLNEEALAYELAARFYIARNIPHLARFYL